MNAQAINTQDKVMTEVFNVINKIVTLTYNVEEGCEADEDELDEQMERIPAIKEWAEKNNKIQTIRNFFISKSWGQEVKFIAFDISKMFND